MASSHASPARRSRCCVPIASCCRCPGRRSAVAAATSRSTGSNCNTPSSTWRRCSTGCNDVRQEEPAIPTLTRGFAGRRWKPGRRRVDGQRHHAGIADACAGPAGHRVACRALSERWAAGSRSRSHVDVFAPRRTMRPSVSRARITPARGDWRIPAYIVLSGKLQPVDDGWQLRARACRHRHATKPADTRVPFALGIAGTLRQRAGARPFVACCHRHARKRTGAATRCRVERRCRHGARPATGRARCRRGRTAWPPLPSPLGQSTSRHCRSA